MCVCACVHTITLATRSVLCRMLTAAVDALPHSGSAESVCYIIIIIHSYTFNKLYTDHKINKALSA